MPADTTAMNIPPLKPNRSEPLFAGHMAVVECVPGDVHEADLLALGYRLTNQKIDPATGVIHVNVWVRLTGKGC